jgi:outer membrane receptor protein involved in Fe transport
MRRHNEQVSASFQSDPGDPLTFVLFTDNADSGENYGLESSLTWAAGRGLSFGGALGVLETRYIGYEFNDMRSLSGREQAHAPQYQLTLTGEYRSARGVLARLDAQRVDDFYFDTSHDERAPARTVVNLKVGVERERWAASLWARNLFDEHYAVRGFFFGNEPPDFTARRYVQPGDPRQVGVTFNYSFR